MKAIITQTIPVTISRPFRVTAKAEGVKPLTLPWSTLEGELLGAGQRPNVESVHALAARKLCERQQWSGDLASGGLLTAGLFAHCFIPDEKKPVSVNDTLAPLWERNEIQFPRLIAEAEFAGFFTRGNPKYPFLLEEMGLTASELSELVERAVSVWDALKDGFLSGEAPKVHRFGIQISGCTREQAEQVLRERLGHDEDYGFNYSINF